MASQYPASYKQVAFITSLRRERNLEALTPGQIGRLTSREASSMIDGLLKTPTLDQTQEIIRLWLGMGMAAETLGKIMDLPDYDGLSVLKALQEAPAMADVPDWRVKGQKAQVMAKATVAPQVQVPAGRYALETPEGVKFYKLDCPTEGRWAGYTFLNAQASDEFWPIKDRQTKTAIMAKIAEDPQAASIRYGKELGVCGICGRTLTDEESRERGIGPVCASRQGW